jgi:ATP-dependent RNA helicase DDX19/DBP5
MPVAVAPATQEEGMAADDTAASNQLAAKIAALQMNRQKVNVSDRLKVLQSDPNNPLFSMKTFQEMSLPPLLLDGVFLMGFDKPMPIQAEAFPRILAEPPRNLIAQAQSGSGKTAAFVLGMLYRTVVDAPATTQAMCVTPTRELAKQIVEKCLVPMSSKIVGLRWHLGVPGDKLPRGTKLDCHIIVGTPGTIVSWLKMQFINPIGIKILVFDEADEMCNENSHRANSKLIKSRMSQSCQTLLFSATFPQAVLTFADQLVGTCDKILLESNEMCVVEEIKQVWLDTAQYQGGKLEFLADMYSLMTIGQSMVFVNTVRGVDDVVRKLTTDGYKCSKFYGKGVEGEERDAEMKKFISGETTVLVTTDVLSRGVDVDNVCMVINYDLPTIYQKDRNAPAVPDYETYLHRIGRTGRAGKKGTAVNLVDDQGSKFVLAAIEKHFSPTGAELIQWVNPCDPEKLADILDI